MSEFWAGKRVLVTGAHGFVGRYLCPQLVMAGAEVYEPTHHEFDLINSDDTNCMFVWAKPEIVIHLAGVVGGIGYNQKYPTSLFEENILMGVNVIQSCSCNAEKLVVIGTTCSYPKMTPIPFREEDLWNGYPEETNAPYGIAKRALLTMCQAYRQQYGLNAIYLIPANLYGPGQDSSPESSHVIPAMIRKFIEARDGGADSVTLWGDGSATREFLYVDDCAAGILLAAERYNKGEPVNLGGGYEISMHQLAYMIMTMTSFDGVIKWDISRPNGQPRRKLDTSKAFSEFGFTASTFFYEGLNETIKWYEENRNGR